MIELTNVTKRYGTAYAVREVSFSAPKGRVVGLLGQNGAGKTTILNILTGYLPPTGGKVSVGGRDMMREPRQAKRLMGYLPEKPPLYDEMTVDSYLRFVCSLKEVERRAIPAHVDEIVETTGLAAVRGRRLGNLSKGYRQRAGIAQALCGDPEAIVLDEPTVGLDPRQVAEIRRLIQSLGENHTVLFSSHMLAEIQQLCQRVVILHRGRLVREADMAEWTQEGELRRFRAAVAMKEKPLLPALYSLSCVKRVQVLPTDDVNVTQLMLECSREEPERAIFTLLCGLNAPLMQLTPVTDTLEEIFLNATSQEDEEPEAR